MSDAWWECWGPSVRVSTPPQFSPWAFTNCAGPKTGCWAAGEDPVRYKCTPEALWQLGIGKQSRKPRAQPEKKEISSATPKAGYQAIKQSKLFPGLGSWQPGYKIQTSPGVQNLSWAPCWMWNLLKKNRLAHSGISPVRKPQTLLEGKVLIQPWSYVKLVMDQMQLKLQQNTETTRQDTN